ncbi:hypothetical protein BC937DRAFT_88642 [Endogone sp. FLAS-F59071]|nr:hypothetical protein BC937DRAFT_88642 [Endogone sp. FLAS-F59071]|eukprot:RUS18539.1 hypothetical protein BC937DRAFT_88642 [Endogone sp. FLAS-F59071]
MIRTWMAPSIQTSINSDDPEARSRSIPSIQTILSWSRILIELLAMATMAELKEHFNRALKYGKHLDVREVWVIHFTCATKEPFWPSSKQLEAGLNVVHFLHDLEA